VGERKRVEEFKAYLTAGETKNDVKEARRGIYWLQQQNKLQVLLTQ
jgi:hypothetical protein